MLKDLLKATTQKGINLKALYNEVRKEGSLTKAEIADQTGLKPSTASRLIEELLNNGLLIENGEAKSSGGRKPKKYSIKPDINYLVGIEISRTFSKVLLLSLDLHILEEKRFEMDRTSTPEMMIRKFSSAIEEMFQNQDISISKMLGIGISTIGPLDTEKGIMETPHHFPAPGWRNVPIKQMLRNYFGTEVVLDYGENAALIAESRHGAARNCKNVFYVNKGVGVRLGMMLDGNLLRSKGTDKIGSFGHMVVDAGGRKCSCGNYGCVSTYSTIPSLVEEVKSRLKRGQDSLLSELVDDYSKITFFHIVHAAKEKDPLCEEVLKDIASYAGMSLYNLITMIRPQKIILGGPMYRKLDIFYESTVQVAEKKYKRVFPVETISFSRGKLGENAAAIGAGSLILDSLLNA